MNMRIISTGSELPKQIISNQDLEKMVDTSDAWIFERTGIRTRHKADGDTVASLAAKACLKALKKAGKSASEVDLILVATCSYERYLPCAACQVQDQIGAINAVAFDLNAACSGFLFGLATANAYLMSGVYKNALVVGSEVLSNLIDYEDRGTCILFGDGAGAVYLELDDENRAGILGISQHSDGAKGEVLACKCRTKDDTETPYITMDGKEVYRFATRQVPNCIEEALEKSKLDVNDIDLYVLHQANKRIVESIAKHLKVSMDHFPTNLEHVGNTSSAAIPILLDELNEKGMLQRGQKLVLSGFGAGLTYGAIVLEW